MLKEMGGETPDGEAVVKFVLTVDAASDIRCAYSPGVCQR